MFLDEKNENEFILDFLVKLEPALQSLMPLDCIIGVSDTEKLICSLPGKEIKLPTDNVGAKVTDDLPVARAIKSGKPQRMISPKEVLGISFEATAIPIFNSKGEVIGGIGLGIGLENREILINNANLVAESSEQTLTTIGELASSAGQLAD